jgi:hypothetical protein
MDMIELILSIGGFSLLLFILVAALVMRSKNKNSKKDKKSSKPISTKPVPSFEKLKSKLKDKALSSKELKEVLDDIIEFHGKIKAKKDYMPSEDFKRYMEVIFILCRHPKTTKDLIRGFEKSLASKNSTYAKEIDKAVTNGLKARV